MKKSYECPEPSTPTEGRSTMSTVSTVSPVSPRQESLKVPTRATSDYCSPAIKKDTSWYAVQSLNEPEKKKECISNECNKKKKRGSSLTAKRAVSVCSHVVEEEPALMEKRVQKKAAKQTNKDKTKTSKGDKAMTKKAAPKKKKTKEDSVSLENTDTDDKGSKEKLAIARGPVQKDAGIK